MNILCVTQGQGLKLFDALARSLVPDGQGQRSFIVSDSVYYKHTWLKNNPDFGAKNSVLKEWDVTAQRHRAVNLELLAEYERELGGPGVFGAMFADRRMVMGQFCAYQQDYRRRFPDEELLSMLQECLVRIDEFLKATKPDLICGFICVTPLEYLVSLFARARGIRYINLRTSRISNYFLLGSTILDPSPELYEPYQRFQNEFNPYRDQALAHIQNIRSKKVKYEGVVPPSEKPPIMRNSLTSRVRAVLGAAYASWFRYDSEIKRDNAIAPPIRAEIIKNFIVPLRALYLMRKLEKFYVYPKDMEEKKFVFFPLHTEPELQLLVYSRPYMNQIEAIRAIAMALPPDTVLVIKEHPWMVGKRKWNYYKKIMAIPRVVLSAPQIDTSHYVDKADMIITLGSSVGLDATMFGKPVITLGHCLYNILPSHMVRRVADMSRLPWEIRDLLKNHHYDENALCAFIGAVMEHGVPINFYSVLLNKSGVHKEQATTFDGDVRVLSNRIQDLIAAQPQNAKVSDATVMW